MSPDSTPPDCDFRCDLEEIQDTVTILDQVVDMLLGILYTVATYVVKIWDLF